MNITVFRIDDRLIHGQVATSWIKYAEAKQIVIADDLVINDSFQQTLLKMATPKGVKLILLGEEEARNKLKEVDDNGPKTLFLTRGPVEANNVIGDDSPIKSVNVGNLNMRKGKEKILDNLWVFEEDIKAFKELSKKGIDIEFRTLPNDRQLHVIELLEKL